MVYPFRKVAQPIKIEIKIFELFNSFKLILMLFKLILNMHKEKINEIKAGIKIEFIIQIKLIFFL